ncbi:hypothetical protein [Paraburkholderia tagetis]|uniref:Uncharacterized protein n=1 Tax=Paraburkholderia tagetis TaxID=2913261 RepID=A0A9X1ZXJ0_9BURK|nr:hypothetical protein [Paraburkholderia tagetis]MCG5077793.1 hypothetical protein [Paraburkholderia tagetis]
MHLEDRRILARYMSAWAGKLGDVSAIDLSLERRKNNSGFDAMQSML